MTPEVQSLIDQLRDHMAFVNHHDRIDISDRIMDGYCRYCGMEDTLTHECPAPDESPT